jgi:predicted Zn-dependent protease
MTKGKFLKISGVSALMLSVMLTLSPVNAQQYSIRVYPKGTQSVSQGQSYVQQAPLQSNIYYAAPSTQALMSPEAIVRSLLTANKLDPAMVKSIQIVNDKTMNAATNGQDIMVTQGLWNKLTTNDQRAFVIGHEMSHIVLHHIGQTQARRVGLSLLDRFVLGRYVQAGSLLDVATNLGLGLVDKRSSRTLEYKADDLGMQLVVNAGYRPQSAVEVFNVLEAAGKSGGPEFLLDHPITRSRMQALVNKYKIAAQK